MKVVFRGWAAITSGEKSVSIVNSSGEEVFYTSDKTVNTKAELKQFLKDTMKYLKEKEGRK